MRYEARLSDGSLLILTPFNASHITPQYLDWFDDVEVTKYNSHGAFPYNEERVKQFLQDIESEKILVWAINYKRFIDSTGCNTYEKIIHVGNVSLQKINWINRSAEIAILIGDKTHWGKGIGMAACNIVLNHAFNALNMSRVWTGTAATNIGMQKICESLGMQKEATFRQGVFLNGRYEDVYCYGTIKDEI